MAALPITANANTLQRMISVPFLRLGINDAYARCEANEAALNDGPVLNRLSRIYRTQAL